MSQELLVLPLRHEDVRHVQEMLRQQLLGDEELLRDILTGRENPERRLEVIGRIRCVRSMADGVAAAVYARANG